MSATITVNRQCSRCPREDREEISLKEAGSLAKTGLKKPSAVKVIVDGEDVIDIESLCKECRQIVSKYLQNINKKLKHRSSLREKQTVEIEVDEEAAQ